MHIMVVPPCSHPIFMFLYVFFSFNMIIVHEVQKHDEYNTEQNEKHKLNTRSAVCIIYNDKQLRST